MDVTYKRISEPIIRLNFPAGIEDSKILARRKLKRCEISDNEIILNTYQLDNFKEYQSIIIATDMLNVELIETGTKDILTKYSLPNKFSLGSIPSRKEIKDISDAREKISSLNDDMILEINDEDERQLYKIYLKNSDKIIFSDGEYKQLKEKYKKLYYISSEKSLNEVRKIFSGTFWIFYRSTYTF